MKTVITTKPVRSFIFAMIFILTLCAVAMAEAGASPLELVR